MKMVYSELNGEEIKSILLQRIKLMLDTVPYLQRHLTIPRVRMSVAISLEQYADQPVPQTLNIEDEIDVQTDWYCHGMAVVDKSELADSVTAAPIFGGQPPDQIREQHNLPTMQAAPIRDAQGRKIATSDVPVLDGEVIEALPGLKIDRTGASKVHRGATVVEQDFGIAGVGGAPRDPRRDSQGGLSFGNSNRDSHKGTGVRRD